MVDRRARDQMVMVIRSYMDDEITAFQLDDALSDATDRTDDRTVQAVAQELWCHYDDCRDHQIVATKQQWDYFNRLLLLLESDAELEVARSWWEWHLLQGAAAVLLATFIAIAFRVGSGGHLFVCVLLFGPPSMFLAQLNARRSRAAGAMEAALTPFPSLRSLLSVRRQVRGFVRRRYPSSISYRRIRDPLINKLVWVPGLIAWCGFSPAVLLFQMLPTRKTQTRIKMPEHRSDAQGSTT